MAPAKSDELSIEQAAFEAIEKDFHEVLSELAGDASLEKFRVEYEKLHRALKKSHENEKRLISRVKELGSEIVGNANKVKTALKLSQEDQATIASLKKEIERAWKMVDSAHEKESKAKDTIHQLKAEIASLSKLVEQGAGVSVGQESTVTQLMKDKEQLTRERDTMVTQVSALRTEVSSLLEKNRTLEQERMAAEHKIKALKDIVHAKKSEADLETRRKERLERELSEMKSALEKRVDAIQEKQELLQMAQDRVKKLEKDLREQKAATTSTEKELETLTQKQLRLQTELNEQITRNTNVMQENVERENEIMSKEREITSLRTEISQLTRQKEALNKRIAKITTQKDGIESERMQMRNQIAQLEGELDLQDRAANSDKKKIDTLKREQDLLNRQVRKEATETQKQSDLVQLGENQKRNLEQELSAHKAEAQKQRRLIFALEKEREKYGQEASEALTQYQQALEEIKTREMTIQDLQKKIQESDMKMKQQQSLYEAVRADRNLYSKNLVESQDDIAELHRKFKVLHHQITQLKDEIHAKDEALVREHYERRKVEKESDRLRLELQKVRRQIGEAEQTISTQRSEAAKLNHVITEADGERARQRKEYEIVMGERDILGTQLIRRNDELALLYEKIKIQQSALQKGEAQYMARLQDIRLLKIKVADLRRELAVTRKSVGAIDEYRREILRLHKELLEERIKVRALSDELQTPMNIHRWRRLEGSDPSTFELIKKVQTLQKRLIAKTEEVAEKDVLIEEKEKLYLELKKVLARQPGPEVVEQLTAYQSALRDKTKALKAMAGELNMYQTQVKELKFEIERLHNEMGTIKKKYFSQRRKERAVKAEQMAAANSGPIPLMEGDSSRKFVGGGFNVAMADAKKARMRENEPAIGGGDQSGFEMPPQ